MAAALAHEVEVDYFDRCVEEVLEFDDHARIGLDGEVVDVDLVEEVTVLF